MKTDSELILHEALNLWWLRPENALAVASYIVNGVKLTPNPGEKAIEFACGDGVNTFFKCGGRFSKEFDLFKHGISKENTLTVATKSVDVFDHYDEDYMPIIITQPDVKYYMGTDHKESLIKKAEKLNFFDNVVVADLQEDIDINDGTIDLIYCNSLYWILDTKSVLEKMIKKLSNNGRIILDVFTTNKYRLDYSVIFPTLPSEWHNMMNRGRMETNPGLRSEKKWETLFDITKLEIIDKRNIFPAAIAQLWNVGLRPIFPLLNKMSNCLTEENRKEIKEEWVYILTNLLLPFLESPEDISSNKYLYRIQYVLKKKQ